MTATSTLLRGRRAAEALMLDTVTVTRADPGATTTDPESGQVVPASTTIYTGVGKIQSSQRSLARPAMVGEAERYVTHLELHLPVSATGVAADDIATVTASTLDPDLVGCVFHVRELAHKTFLTARRFEIIEVTS